MARNIRQRDDGRYEGRVTIEYRDGTSKRQSFYGRTADEVKEQIRIAQVKRRAFQPRNILVRDFLKEVYLKSIEPIEGVGPTSQRVRYSTYSTREIMVRVHLIPTLAGARVFGLYKLDDLSAGTIRQLLSQLESNGVGGAARQKAYETLRVALNYAVSLEYIEFNPATNVEKPIHKAKETVIPEEGDFAILLAAIDRSPHRALFTLAATTGMRQAEILGLRWESVDLAKGVLRVREQLTRVKPGRGGRAATAPKTESGRREIILASEAIEALKVHRKATKGQSEWVFHTRTGGSINRHNFSHRIFFGLLKSAGPVFWDAAAEAAGLKANRITFHGLRHLVATLLAEEETNPQALKALLGHQNYKTTANLYTAHRSKRMREHAASKVRSVFDRIRAVGSQMGSERTK